MTDLYYDDPVAASPVKMKSRAVADTTVPSHDVESLPGTVEPDISASRGFLATLAGAIASGRMAVDLTTAVTGYLQTLAGAVTAARVAVNLDATPAANLATLAGSIATGNMKAILQAGTAAIGKLAANVGVNIGTVDVASGSVALSSALPAGTNAIGKLSANAGVNIGQVDLALTPTANLASIAADTGFLKTYNPSPVLAAGTAAIGKLAPNSGVNIGTVDVTSAIVGQLPAGVGAKTSAASLSVVLASDHATQAVSLAALPPLAAGTAAIGKLAANVGVNVGTVDVANALQLPATLGQRNMATSLGVAIASDQSALTVKDGGTPLMVIGNGGNPLPVTGTVTVGNSVVATIGTGLPAGNAIIGKVDVNTMPGGPTTATVIVIPAVASAVTLAAQNSARVGLMVANNATSTSTLWVKFGSNATLSSWSVPVEPGGYYEMPPRYYAGVVTGVWSNTTGDAHVTET
jgi:hypothetical protein